MQVIGGSPISIYGLSKTGMERGMEDTLAPGSVLRSFGSLKGMQAAPDLRETLLRFDGVSDIKYGYGMTELSSGFAMCSAGPYHVPPWIIAYILDPLSGNPKPREGVQEGRGAFLIWSRKPMGGCDSGGSYRDQLEPMPCGRTSPHINDDIKRATDAPEREHCIGPAPDDAALTILTEGLV